MVGNTYKRTYMTKEGVFVEIYVISPIVFRRTHQSIILYQLLRSSQSEAKFFANEYGDQNPGTYNNRFYSTSIIIY